MIFTAASHQGVVIMMGFIFVALLFCSSDRTSISAVYTAKGLYQWFSNRNPGTHRGPRGSPPIITSKSNTMTECFCTKTCKSKVLVEWATRDQNLVNWDLQSDFMSG